MCGVRVCGVRVCGVRVKVMMYNFRGNSIRWLITDLLSIGYSNVLDSPAYTSQNSQLKSMTLKI